MTKVNFSLILVYVEIPASHQSEDSELWALTAILATKWTAMKRHSAESALEKLRRRGKFDCLTALRKCVPATKRSTAVYCLGGSDTSDTQVEEGAAVRAGAPDLTVPMPVLACKKQVLKR